MEQLEARNLFAISTHIDIEPAGASTYSGYLPDIGAAYGVRSSGPTYGWYDSTGTIPTDNAPQTRQRNSSQSPDQRYDTFAFMEKSGVNPATWGIAVPNGLYQVHAVSGDPLSLGAVNNILAEGTPLVTGTTSSSQIFLEDTAVISVSDGVLNLTNGMGGTGDKLNYVDILGVPDSPAGLNANSPKSTEIDLSWSPSTYATSYTLQRSTASDFSANLTNIPTGTATNISDTGLSTGTQYYYRVSATDAAGTSLTSTPVAQWTRPSTPTASAVDSTATPTSEIDLAWTKPAGTTSFNIYRSTDGGNTYPFLTAASATTLSYPDTHRVDGTTYYYHVNAVDTGGEGGSGFAHATTTLSTPTNFTAVSGNSTGVTLAWTADPNSPLTYQVQDSIDGGSNFNTLVNGLPSSTATYPVTGLTAGTNYVFKLSAVESGLGDAATTASVTTRPSTPTLNAVAVSANHPSSEVDLSWTNVRGETGYNIYRSTDGISFSLVNSTAADVTTYADQGLVDGVAYTYRINAFNSSGEGGGGTGSATTILAVPANLTAVSGNSTGVTLNWTPDPNSPLTYTVEDLIDGGTTWNTVVAGLSSATQSATASGLNAGTNYSFRLSAVESGLNNAATIVAVITKPSTATVSSVAVSTTDPATIDLTWVNAHGEVGYHVYRSTDGTNFSQIADLPTDTVSYSDSGLNDGTTYYYQVNAYNASGEGGTGTGHTALGLTTPSALVATATASNSVTLSWASVPRNANDSIEVDFCTDDASWLPLTTSLPGNSTSYIAGNLLTGTPYYFHVVVNQSGLANVTGWVNSKTKPATPSTGFAVLKSVSNPAGEIDLAWPNMIGADGYYISISTDNASYTPLYTSPANALSYAATNLLDGTKYYFHVNAFDVSGQGGTASGSDTTDLAAPTSLAATHTSNTVALTWSNISLSANSLEIDRATNGGSWSKIATLAGTLPSTYLDNSYVSTYSYRLIAKNVGGQTATSATLSLSAGPAVAAPGAPKVTSISATVNTLNWVAVAGVTSYKIQRSSNGTDFTTVSTATGVTYNDYSAVASAPTYYYRIIATANGVDSSPSAVSSVSRLALLYNEAVSSVAATESSAFKSDGSVNALSKITLRDLVRAAYIRLELNLPYTSPDGSVTKTAAARAEDYLNMCFSKQLTGTNDPAGAFPWTYDSNTNTDYNSVEFVMSLVGPIFLQFHGQFDQGFIDSSKPKIDLALSALKSHVTAGTPKCAPPSYTNIYTMNFTSMILLGQVESTVYNDTSTGTNAINFGTNNLATWVNQVKSDNGIHEFDSSTYSETQLNNLLAGYSYTTGSTQQSYKSMLDLLTDDLIANYFDGRGDLSGPHSRDYDFTDGRGSVEQWYYEQGLRSAAPEIGNNDEAVATFVNDYAGYNNGVAAYQPKSTQLGLANGDSRIVQSEFGSNAGQDRYNYITAGYAIGSSSSFYDSQNKQISIDLKPSAPGKQLSQISLAEDKFDSPYGDKNHQDADNSGHKKPTVLNNSLTSLQDKGTILALSNLNQQFVKNPSATYTSLATNFIIPANADKIYILKAGSWTQASTASGTTYLDTPEIGVLEGNSLIAIRYFHADIIGAAGNTLLASQQYALTFGDGPYDLNTGRFIAYHFEAATPTSVGSTAPQCQTGVLVEATSLPAGFADQKVFDFLDNENILPITVTNATDLSSWSASTTVGGEAFLVQQNTTASSYGPAARTLNGSNYVPRALYLTTLTGSQTATDDLFHDILGN